MSGCYPYESNNDSDLTLEITKLRIQLKLLKEHKDRQIDENKKISRRVDELEKILEAFNKDAEYLDSLSLPKRLEKLELKNIARQIERIANLEKQMKEILGKQDFHQALTNAAICTSKKTHKCPVCDGQGYWHKVENNIACGAQCSTCKGSGIVWG